MPNGKGSTRRQGENPKAFADGWEYLQKHKKPKAAPEAGKGKTK